MKLKKIIFALVAMLSSFAFTANAQVAKVGETKYATIDEAIAAWGNGTTLTLLADVTLSDVIKLSSTEHHILNLGTYTMTAAKNKDAIQYVVKGRSSAGSALDIKADAANPGGITATGKAIVVHLKPSSNAPEKDRPITCFYGGVFNAANIVKQYGTKKTLIWETETNGYTGASAPHFYFHGGVFNGDISTNRSYVKIEGGTFNGKLYTSFDSSSWGNIKGGKFKYLSNLMGSNLDEKIAQGVNNYKFTIGSAKATYDRGIYVDKDGYYVITSAPIKEVSAKYPAVYKKTYGGDDYFYYSAAQEYGLFYEDANMAIEKHGAANVTVWEPVKAPAVEEIVKPEATEEEKAVVEEVIAEVTNNAAVKNNTVELPAEVVNFSIELAAVEVAEETTPEAPEAPAATIVTEISYTVTPSNAAGEKVSKPSEPITFRLPLPSNWASEKVKVIYNGTALDGDYEVKTENDAKYVEVESQSFSTYTVKAVAPVAQIGEQKYATLAEAITAAQNGETISMIADVELTAQVEIPAGKVLTLDLNGKIVTVVYQEESTTKHIYALSNYGTLTIKDTKGNGSINSRGIFVQDGSKLTVESGSIYGIDSNGGSALYQYGGDIVINGGHIEQKAEGTYNFAINALGGTVTVNGGKIAGNHGAIAAGGATVVINDGELVCTGTAGMTDNVLYTYDAGEITINGGTFVADNDGPAGGCCVYDANGNATINGGTFSNSSGGDVWGTTGTTIKGGKFENLTEKQHIAAGYELNADGTVAAKPVAEVNGVKYASFADAAAAAQAGNEIKLLANIEGDITVPAGVIFNGNGFAVSGVVTAAGEITFAGVTKVGNFGVQYVNTTVNIPAGASLQLTGTGRMVIGHGCTFNITGSIADDAAKTTDKATLTPSLVMPGASFTGAGVTFNVTNAYISAPSSYCSSSKSASGTFDFNINNSIWEQFGKLAFESQSTAATVNFDLVNSVLTTTSHLVFGVSRGEVVIDNSNVNVGKSNQIENQSTMTIKNGSVVNGAVATNSNAKNPGTVIVENATYAVTGEFSGSDLGTGTLVVKKDANVTIGSITKANIVIDAADMAAGELANFTANLSKLAGTLEVINNDKLEAKIVDGKIVLAAKPVAKIGDVIYTDLADAFKAATSGCTIEILSDVTVDYYWDARNTGAKFTVPVTINGNGKTIKFTASVNDNNYQAPFRFEADATVNNLIVDMSEVTDNRFRAISSKGNLTVDGCKFIGKDETLNCRAIIFGEGAGANVGNLAVSITNSEFINWKRGITDNENAQDVKTVTITGNTLTDAGVGVSATDNVTFTDNAVSGAYVNIKSYTAGNKLAVTATGNTLEANTETAYNVIDAGGVVNAEGFKVVAKGGSMIGYTSTEGIYGEVWGNSRESFVIKVVDAQGNVMGTTSLNNVGGIIDGDVYVTWNIKFNAAANTDEYWTMAWTTAPSIDNMPAKVQLWVDGTNVSEGDVVLNGPDNLWPIAVAVTDAEGNILSCHETIAAAVAANATNIALLRNTDEVIKLPLGVTLDKNGFTADGVTVTLPVAKIGEHNFASVNDALAYAKEAGLTNLEITIIGTNDVSTTDSFDLVYTTLFDNVTIKQDNGGVAYYIYDLYTGSRTNAGKFVFDGVNIVVTDQYMFEGNVELSNNSLITSVAEANCFVYYAEVTVEAGSKIDGVIEDIRGGSLIIDGGKTDGTYCETPGLLDAILAVNWADSKLVLKNGAYVKVNAANEVGRLTVNGTLDVTDSKLESYEYIAVNSGATMNLNAGSVVTTKKVEGAGKITVDATGLEGTVTVINGNMAGFTGAIEVVGNDYAKYEITEAGLVINSSYIAELTLVDGEEFDNDSEKTVGKLTYVRTLPAAGIWYPVFLPFDVPVDALAGNFDVARINDLHTNFSEEDGSIEKMWVEYIVKKSGTLAAGKPFLVRAKSSDVLDMVIELDNVTLYPSSKKSTIIVSSAITKVTFEGVYEVTSCLGSTPSTRYMAVNADGVWDEFDGYSLNPFRVMMTLEILDEEYYINPAASLSVGARVIGEENEDGTTTIYDVEADREENDMIFDLQGRRVLETEKGGVYIKNGKKFIVK